MLRRVAPGYRLHDLRHSCASGLLSLGMEERMVGAVLGHAPSSMTAHYARPDIAALRPWLERWLAAIAPDVAGLALDRLG